MKTVKYIEVADGNFVTEKTTGEFQINMRDDNKKTFIAMLYSVIFAPDSRHRLFSIVTLMNSVHTCFLQTFVCGF